MKQPHPDALAEKDEVADAIFARIVARPEFRLTKDEATAALVEHEQAKEDEEVPVIFTFFGLSLADLWGYIDNEEWWNPDA